MSDTATDRARGYLVESREVLQRAIDDRVFCRTIRDIAEVAARALEAGNKLLLAGSAGDAQHLAGEMLSRLNYDRAPAAAIALTTDSSALTPIGNDYAGGMQDYSPPCTRLVTGSIAGSSMRQPLGSQISALA